MQSRLIAYHASMLADTARVAAFDRAIRASIRPGDTVLDLGTGTGLLAMLACRAGARKVYAIEAGEIAMVAREVIEANGFTDRVELLRGRSNELQLPERVDVLVGEIVGNVGLEEGILGSFLDARDRFLKPGGVMIPQKIDLVGAPIEVPPDVASFVECWTGDIRGLNYACVRGFASQQMYVANLQTGSLRASPETLLSVDLSRATEPFLDGTARYELQADVRIDGLGAWFRADLGHGETLSNAPPNEARSWNHGVFPFREAITLPAGATLELRLSTYDGRIWRWQVPGSSRNAALDQSTFAGFPLELSRWRAQAGDAPVLVSERAQAALRALAGAEAGNTLDQLAHRLANEHPELFPSRIAARALLARLVRVCGPLEDRLDAIE